MASDIEEVRTDGFVQSSGGRIEVLAGTNGEVSSGPVAGLRVVDFSRGFPGALTTMLLADYGADVVKVVGPEGDPLGTEPGFRVWNRGKRRVELDLRSGEGVEGALALASRADVVLESWRAGVADGIGIGYGAVRERNPGVIYCSISSFGEKGPLKKLPGYEGIAAAASGIMTEQAGVRPGPVYVSSPVASLGTVMLALQGVLAALHVRNETGVGQRVWTSMYEGAIAIRYPVLPISNELPPFIVNNVHPHGGMPAYRMYPCADDKWIHIGSLTRWFWDKLAIALDLPELVVDTRFDTAPTGWPEDEDRLAAIEIIGKRLGGRPRAEWLKVLEAGDVPMAPVLTTQEYMDVPQVHHNGLVVDVKDPVLGDMKQVGHPIIFSETPGKVRGPAPVDGAETPSSPLPEELFPKRGDEWGLDGHGSTQGRTPLQGLRVLDFSAYIAGPLGPMALCDLGADVVKVEPLQGEGAHSIPMLILGSNRGKRDLALDLKAPESREVIRRLIERSDVLVHNMRVGVAERLGIDYESARAIRPDIIYVHSTAYGPSGPEARKPGFDPLFQSMSGLTAWNGGRSGGPIFLRTAICDDTNALMLAVAVLMALNHRDRTGEGQKIDLSLMKTGALATSDDFMRYEGKKARKLADAGVHGMSALYRMYETAEGWVFLSCVQEKEWERLKGALRGEWDEPDVTFEEASIMDPWNEGLCEALSSVFARGAAQEWEARLVEKGVPCVRVAQGNMEGFYENAHAIETGMVYEGEHPIYTGLRQPGVLVHFSETGTVDNPPSALIGQHTVEVLGEMGYSSEEIEAMLKAGLVGVPE